MKTKKMAKPVKGSARTKRFMDGGTVGALAGLGTLAYLLSRKKDKKDESPESGGMSRDPKSSTVMETLKKNAESNENKPTNESSYAPESKFGASDIGFGGGVDDGIRVSPKPAPKKTVSKAKGYNPPATDSSQPPADNETRPSKPYPINSKPNEDRPSKKYPINSKPNEERASKPYPINSKPNEERPSKPYPEKEANNSTSAYMTSKPKAAPVTTKPNDERPTKPYPSDAERAKTKAAANKPAEKKYGIGPHGAFAGVHKAISEYKTPAQVNAEKRRQAKEEAEKGRYKKGGAVKKYASGGMVKARGDGIAQRGKTKGRMC
jgi:hypothetical protein